MPQKGNAWIDSKVLHQTWNFEQLLLKSTKWNQVRINWIPFCVFAYCKRSNRAELLMLSLI